MPKDITPPPLIVYVDVDDTLIRTVGTKRIPMADVVQHVRTLFADGAERVGSACTHADRCPTRRTLLIS